MKKAPGVLPSPRWLNTNGYSGLVDCMKRAPNNFAHIEQRKKRQHRSLCEAVELAEQLAVRNGGVLPCSQRLIDHGYTGLPRRIRQNPTIFSHIPQQRLATSPVEWATKARRLVKDNGGTLPNHKWLVANGYGGMVFAMRHNPELFDGISQERSKTPLAIHIQEAQGLAREHGGRLPTLKWMKDHGFAALVSCINHNPAEFQHIRRYNRKRRRPKEWAAFAQDLIDTHGRIPSTHWMYISGCIGLYHSMRRHPHLFAHIKQKKLR